MTVRRAPGKLYVAGEYAVVEPGHRALLVAVDRFLTVRVGPGSGQVRSAAYPGGFRRWRRGPDGTAEPVHGRLDYVISAVRTVEALVTEAGGELGPYDMELVSDLDDPDGRKLGLGSSAAATVATVRAVAAWYRLSLDDHAVYRLALLASDAVQPVGSGGDLAASALAGWVSYASPDRDWLRQARRRSSCTELLAATWPGLRLRRLTPPAGLRLLVGWTGAPASSADLVAGVQAWGQARDQGRYRAFQSSSEACLQGLEEALTSGDLDAVVRLVAENRRLLAELGRLSQTTIETPALTRLIEIAAAHGAAAKTSGAGGGDCGIALCPPGTDLDAVRADWREAGITPLDLTVHTEEES